MSVAELNNQEAQADVGHSCGAAVKAANAGSATHWPSRSLRIMYVEYAGDVIGTFRHWLSGCGDPTEVAKTYSGQVLDAFAAQRVRLLVPGTRRSRLSSGHLHAQALYHPFARSSGVAWHLGQFLLAMGLLWRALRFRPTHLFVSSLAQMFLLAPLRLIGIRIVPIYRTCPRGPSSRKLSPNGLLYAVNRIFLKWCAHRVIALEPRAARMLTEDCPPLNNRIVGFLPSFRECDFPKVSPRTCSTPTRLLFIGRLEQDKGIFDCMDMLWLLLHEHGVKCRLDVCGSGQAYDRIETYIKRLRLGDHVKLHGRCSAEKVRWLNGLSDLCIVPTRSSCHEGFNKVIAEAVLHGLPVVSSTVCPATELLGDCCVLAEADHAESYARVVAGLVRDERRYDQMVKAAQVYRPMLLDDTNSFRRALEQCI